MRVVKVLPFGLSYGGAAFYGWRHCLHVGWWQIFWGQIRIETDNARIAELETLLARNLVFDHGAAEDGLDALGGWNRICDLVTAYREANPLPLAVSDGEEPF